MHAGSRSPRLKFPGLPVLACIGVLVAPISPMAQQAYPRTGGHVNPVTFVNGTDGVVRVRWIYAPVPTVVSVLTARPGEEGSLPMPPASKMGHPLNLLIDAGTQRSSFAIPLPAPGQPGPIRIQIDRDLTLRLTPLNQKGVAGVDKLRPLQKGGFPLTPTRTEPSP